MAPQVTNTIYQGAFVHSKRSGELDICCNGAIGVDTAGKIVFVERDDVQNSPLLASAAWKDAQVVRLSGLGFFFPGFIDTHIHASQYPNAGIFGNSTLLDWLETYTFPLEVSFSDHHRAARIYNQVVSRTISHGTTTAAYFATTHVDATNLLADICQQRGQRAYIGRVCMDSLGPSDYCDKSPDETIRETLDTIKHIKKIDPTHKLITPIITPRFAISVSADSLAALGRLHKQTDYPCQTHISENKAEIELVKQIFPRRESYADIYDHYGLLTNRTILAHAVHLDESEIQLIKARNAKISHCPVSNTALTSGCSWIRKYMDIGIDVGLGTDVSGGYSVSILEAIRQAILVSRIVAMRQGDRAKLAVEEALYLATRGGAKLLNMDTQIGAFEIGMDWDAQMIVLNSVSEHVDQSQANKVPVDIFGWENWPDRVHKWVFTGDDRNTAAVWIKGRLVHSTALAGFV